MANFAFIGLGIMGLPMAGHLAKALSEGGHRFSVFDLDEARLTEMARTYGAQAATSPKEAAKDADIIFACVGKDNDLEAVTTGPDGAFQVMKQGSLFVDHTTASAQLARRLSEAANAAGFAFMDAPISGGEPGAINGVLSIMCGGAQADFERASPYMQSYAKSLNHMGPAGSGQLTKMVNQICLAGMVQAHAEAVNFGQRAGLDMEKAIGVIGGGAAQSWHLDNRGPSMLAGAFDGFGFAVDWMLKDLRMCLSEAADNGAELPVTALVAQFYASLAYQGRGRADMSALLERLRD